MAPKKADKKPAAKTTKPAVKKGKKKSKARAAHRPGPATPVQPAPPAPRRPPLTATAARLDVCRNSFINDIFEKIATEAARLARYNKKPTVTSREIQTSVRLILPGELAKHAVSEGTKAVTKFTSA